MSSSDENMDSSDGYESAENEFYANDDSEKEEVLPINDDYSDDEDSDNVEDGEVDDDEDSDEIGDNEDEDNLKDEAWGKKKSTYFNTDFVDQDRGRSYREEDLELAKAEEADAITIQKKHLQSIHSSVFGTSVFTKKDLPDTEVESIAVPEWKSISKSEKRKLIKRKWPEFSDFVKDFKGKISDVKDLLSSSEDISFDKSDGHSRLSQAKKQLNVQYLINLSFYMYLKAKGAENTGSVVKRIKHMKQLLTTVEDLDKKLALKDKMAVRKLKLTKKKVSFQANSQKQDEGSASREEINMDDSALEAEKRTVTNKIVKNRGLMPYRKKELKNPRVRQRVKFRKAEIRRKGQVKKPRKEISRYGGELSGIHPNVTRSTKIK